MRSSDAAERVGAAADSKNQGRVSSAMADGGPEQVMSLQPSEASRAPYNL